jgi:isocitrate lyase
MSTLLSDQVSDMLEKSPNGVETAEAAREIPGESELAASWRRDARWQGITRPYTAADVERLRGTVQIEYTLARLGAERLWSLLHTRTFVPALGALTGNQAVQQV